MANILINALNNTPVYLNNDSFSPTVIYAKYNNFIWNVSMSGTFAECTKLKLNISNHFGDFSRVKYLANTYTNCYNITGSPYDLGDFEIMCGAYQNCVNLTGSPAQGNNTVNMHNTYYNCYRLTGAPYCGPNVVNMSYAYYNCTNLTSLPACGDNVTDMSYTYYNCTNLTSFPICGDNVVNMSCTYAECCNLTGAPLIGEKVTNLYKTFWNCPNLYGDLYLLNMEIENVYGAFYGHNTQYRLNIYVIDNSNTNLAFYSNGGWSLNSLNKCYYNTNNNIYVYYSLEDTTLDNNIPMLNYIYPAGNYNYIYGISNNLETLYVQVGGN